MADGKNQSVISYEAYGSNVFSRELKMSKHGLRYFLWYVEDQGYKYEIRDEIKDVCDPMEGWCSQCIKFITIQL